MWARQNGGWLTTACSRRRGAIEGAAADAEPLASYGIWECAMQFSSQLRAAAGLVVCVIGTGAAVLGQTLPEMARELGGEAVNQIGIDAPVSSIREAVLDSVLVLRGDIVAPRTRLNADESTVETEYGIRPPEAFKDRLPRAVQTPGTVPTVVFRRGGGRLVTEDGLRVGTAVDIFSEGECFSAGEDVVVMLT